MWELRPAVVWRRVGAEETQFAHPCLDPMGTLDVVDARRQFDHLAYPGAVLRTGEIAADPPAQVGCGADVQNLIRGAAEHVDTGF